MEEKGWRRVGGGFEDGWRRVARTGLAEGGRTGLEEGCWPVRRCARKGAVRGKGEPPRARGSSQGYGWGSYCSYHHPASACSSSLGGRAVKRQQLGWDIAQM